MSITDKAAGVPFLAVPPITERPDAPVVVGWHLLDAPATPAAFAAALPLDGLDAWRVYLALPLSADRSFDPDDLATRAQQDPVLNLYDPVHASAAQEFGVVLDALRDEYGCGTGPLALFGGSAGAAVALDLSARRDDVVATVVVSPVVSLRPMIERFGELYEMPYAWTPAADAVAARMDFVARAPEITVPLRVIVGDGDEECFRGPAAQLVAAHAGPSDLITIEGMGHALAEEPGLEPAPQTPHAAAVDAHVVAWFRRHLAS